MLRVQNKTRLRELRNEYFDTNLDAKLGYLATYGSEDMTVDLLPDERDPYISVIWLRGDRVFMNGVIVLHGKDWNVTHMSMTLQDALSLYTHCDYCGEHMCTEDLQAVLVREARGERWYCCPECLEWADDANQELADTHEALSVERLNRL